MSEDSDNNDRGESRDIPVEEDGLLLLEDVNGRVKELGDLAEAEEEHPRRGVLRVERAKLIAEAKLLDAGPHESVRIEVSS